MNLSPPNSRRLFPLLIAVAAAYWMVLFCLTHIPMDEGPDLFPHFDKCCHFCAYALLAVVLGSVYGVLRGYQPWNAIAIWALCVAYGALDEYTQDFVPGRSTDGVDLLCDAAGAMVGLILLHAAVLALRRYRMPELAIEPDLGDLPGAE